MEFNFKKKYGQNFLTDSNITRKIANTCYIENNNSLVVEIGCGDGRLTKELCKLYKNVLAYEIDTELESHLASNLKDYNNKEIIFDDFLKRDIKEDIKNYHYDNLYIIANLPYYITTPIIEKIIEAELNPKKMVFMVQKEVGDRFSATIKNSKDYSSITVYLNYYFDIKKEFIVNRNSFIPKPNVDSIVISFTTKDELPFLKDKELFNKLIRDSFRFKRKNLRNNLKEYDLDKIGEVLKEYGLDLTSRAEQLNLEVFCSIANNLV